MTKLTARGTISRTACTVHTGRAAFTPTNRTEVREQTVRLERGSSRMSGLHEAIIGSSNTASING